ncbi:hypothetical protein [Ruegeria sp. HKCCSP351]|uniref:hypothetical protein n=1 Tax=Ruegeria sp. HKCCSP351 TaxID=2794832 RepID=UPI001AE6BA64|nr:hypothetical protein [Ruegeria sp. HKCCSP351]
MPVRLSTCAPEIGFAFDNLDWKRSFLGDNWRVRHVASPSLAETLNSLRRCRQKGSNNAVRIVIWVSNWHGIALSHNDVIDAVARLPFNPYSGGGPEKLGNIRKVIED